MSNEQNEPAVLGPVQRQVRPVADAPRWWHCDTHGPGNASAWGCPECVRDMRGEIARMRAALERVARWHGEFPETGKFWDDEKTRQISYGAEYGSNGERDFMRQLALDALRPNVEVEAPLTARKGDK